MAQAESPVLDRRNLLPHWRTIRAVVLWAALAALLFMPISRNTYLELFGEMLFVGIVLLGAFTLAGGWEQNLVPRWVAQVIAVGLAAPLGPLVVQLLTARGDFYRFVESGPHVRGFMLVTFAAVILGTMIALGALIRERDARAHALELQLQLEREMLERQAADARLRLMTAQIQPHFLLNTLANVQALVETGSPRAVPVFRSLIEYLRAAMPQLQEDGATLATEERLVRAYLELMHMRMPDRLTFDVHIDNELRGLRFPAMALLTLVENAIQHGIDPSVDPGHVEVGASRIDAQTVRVWVSDTGVGMTEHAGQGRGLANLDARLKVAFGANAGVRLSEMLPHGVCAEITLRIPAVTSAT